MNNKGYILVVHNNTLAVLDGNSEMTQWLLDYECTEITRLASSYGRFYKFPSDEIRNLFVLRWS